MEKRIQNQILQTLVSKPQSIYELIPHQDASLKEFITYVQELESRDLVRYRDNKLSLNTEKFSREELNRIQQLSNPECENCSQTGYSLSGKFLTIFEQLEQLSRQRPSAAEEFDQGFISSAGVVRRCAFMHQRGDVWNNRIMILGDDDLLSLALGLSGLPAFIQVLEIDERLTSFLNAKAKELDLPLKAQNFDVKSPLFENMQQDFDCFLTDPVETLQGFQLFLSRGISSLKGANCSAYFGLTTLEASREKWYQIQNSLLSMGFVVTDILRNFNIYPQDDSSFARYQEKTPIYQHIGKNPDSDWYMSSFYRIEAVQEPQPWFEKEMLLDEKFYQDQESLATPDFSQ